MRARIVEKKPGEWTNKHHTLRQPIERLYDVWNPSATGAGEQVRALRATVTSLQSLIQDAIDEGLTLRAIGSGWSISDVAATDGRIVNTKPLNWLFGVTESSKSDGYAREVGDLVFAQCGASIAQINEYLVSKGRSLRTQGASNGQTIVGAFSTGSHGSAIDVGGVENYVVGLHLIVGANRHVWLERASYPVVSDSFVNKLETELVRDDALFEAALVSFGSFGIIHAVMIETDPIYLLEANRTRAPYDSAFKAAIGELDLSGIPTPYPDERPRHFDAVINPYDLDNGAFYTVMYRRPYRNDYRPIPTGDDGDAGGWGIRPGDDLLNVVGVLTDEIPPLVPSIVNGVINGQYSEFDDRWGTIGEIFSYNTIHGNGSTGSALGVPLERTNEAVDALLSVTDQHGPFGGVYGLRYVRRSAATLGFTRFDRTCVIDVDGVDSKRSRAFFKRVWQAFDDARIPYTFHWGKVGAFDRDRIRSMYGRSVEEWLLGRQRLLDVDAQAVFSSPFLRHAGLDEIVPGDMPV